MGFLATKDNVILQVPKKKKTADELLIDTGEEDKILLGTIVAAGPECNFRTRETSGTACVYKSHVAVLPWETEDYNFYAVKEASIYGIKV